MFPERLGVFGGTFDPPHLGHLILAAEACSKLELERLLWVLTPDPPHKLDRKITPLEHRLAMVTLAIQDTPAFELSRVEIDRPGPHYMVDTLGLLMKAHPSAELVLLIGGDSLSDLPTWQRRGIGLWNETYQHEGHDPIREAAVTVNRRRLHVERALPMKDAYRRMVVDLVSGRTMATSGHR